MNEHFRRYDVYAALPPLTSPEWDAKHPRHDEPITPLFYAEDNIRAQFYKRFKRNGVFNMSSRTDSVCQQFVREYEAQKKERPQASHEDLFSAATKKLVENGIDLDANK